jgi:O-antigen/teichoic acid export membrane protein
LFYKDVAWKLISIFVIVFYGENLNASNILTSLALVLILCVLVQLILYRKIFRIKRVTTFDIVDVKSWVSELPSYWASSVVRGSAPNIAIIIIGWTLTDEKTGAFFAAWKVASLMNIFTMGANMVLAPMFAKAFSDKELDRIQDLCLKGIAVTALPCVLFTAVVITFGGEVLSLFAFEYREAYGLLVIMSVGVMLNSLCGSTMQLMEMSGSQKVYLRSIYRVNVVAIALMLFLLPNIPVGGDYAAAIILAYSVFYWNLACIKHIKIKYQVDPTVFSILKFKGF